MSKFFVTKLEIYCSQIIGLEVVSASHVRIVMAHFLRY